MDDIYDFDELEAEGITDENAGEWRKRLSEPPEDGNDYLSEKEIEWACIEFDKTLDAYEKKHGYKENLWNMKSNRN